MQYQRYLWLVQLFRSQWDNGRLLQTSPFRIVDPGFNAILLRSVKDLALLAEEEGLGLKDISGNSQRQFEKGTMAVEKLWSDNMEQYLCYDQISEKLIQNPSIAGILEAFGLLPPPKKTRIPAKHIARLSRKATFIIPSHDPSDSRFDAMRYWRGPVWIIVNFLIRDGLLQAGEKRYRPQNCNGQSSIYKK